MRSKSGQVTIFIIVALLIVVGIGLYFSLRGSIQTSNIPESFQPAYTSFLSCLKSDTETGISILESQGGYIYLPDFEPGSEYMPFSSQLNFLGNPVPYWYYVSGNNIQKEQVPTLSEMQQQLEEFIKDKISACNFNSYYDEGFAISLDAADATPRVTINDNRVDVILEMNVDMNKGNESVLVINHKISVDSALGNLYKSAIKVYDEEQSNLFLEEYAVDTLRLYAPVDGVEISCAPKIWDATTIFDELQGGIESNTAALHSEVSVDDYFIVDIPGVKEEVRFLNSKDWPYNFEVTPSEGSLLISNPIGSQAGLGILGFCYVPYHFVYSVKYPVMVQIYSGGSQGSGQEIFQFPVAVVVQNNNPRESLDAEASLEVVPELCQYKNTPIQVTIRNKQGGPLEADISYECFGNTCSIGQTTNSGFMREDFPQCVNGFVTAKAEGYKDTSYLFSTVSAGSLTMIMDELYTKGVQLNVDGASYNGDAIIYFTSEDSTRTIIYPDEKSVQLSEGQYEIQVYIYSDSEITLDETITQQCVEVPRSGVLGIVGLTQERCFDIEIPEQIISQVLTGGGTQNYYVLDSELTSSGSIKINSESFPVPKTMEQLNMNNLLFEESGLDITFGA
ncbi:MAG: hypothetical protein KJ879_02470 [Nanoarchaeota archaeon]|nr:hypothetical protein [Nanoarchaeota archaeon]